MLSSFIQLLIAIFLPDCLPVKKQLGGSYLRGMTSYVEYKGYFNIVTKFHRVIDEIINSNPILY